MNARANSAFSRIGMGVALLCAAVLVVAFIGVGFAGAGSDATVSTFGVGQVTMKVSSSDGVDDQENTVQTDSNGFSVDSESCVLASTTSRDISYKVTSIDAKKEAERTAAEQEARAEELLKIAQAEANRAWLIANYPDSALNYLSEVDWTVGKDAFITEWGDRINAYLQGTNLAGYGYVFAEAAWNNGIDPRWSPAISNTESGNATNCFLPYNAWGWGSSSWSGWYEAINDHVAGLAEGYGYTLTYEFASIYCPPNTEHWYSNTLAQMQLI